jgi:hypothetical protein
MSPRADCRGRRQLSSRAHFRQQWLELRHVRTRCHEPGLPRSRPRPHGLGRHALGHLTHGGIAADPDQAVRDNNRTCSDTGPASSSGSPGVEWQPIPWARSHQELLSQILGLVLSMFCPYIRRCQPSGIAPKVPAQSAMRSITHATWRSVWSCCRPAAGGRAAPRHLPILRPQSPRHPRSAPIADPHSPRPSRGSASRWLCHPSAP